MDRPVAVRARASAHRTLASASRVQILDVLQRSDAALGIDVLADAVGLHPNTTREHLDRLVDGGFVVREAEHLGTRGRPRLLYRAAEASAAEATDTLARDHLMRVLLEGYGCATSSPAARAEEGGRRLAEAEVRAAPARPAVDGTAVPDELRQLAALEEHFESLGFDPESDRDTWQVHLRRCPVRRLALERTDVVCSVHLGLARGVLAASGGPLCASSLTPFVEPDRCVLQLDGAPA